MVVDLRALGGGLKRGFWGEPGKWLLVGVRGCWVGDVVSFEDAAGGAGGTEGAGGGEWAGGGVFAVEAGCVRRVCGSGGETGFVLLGVWDGGVDGAAGGGG